jgi:hypothetical protein
MRPYEAIIAYFQILNRSYCFALNLPEVLFGTAPGHHSLCAMPPANPSCGGGPIARPPSFTLPGRPRLPRTRGDSACRAAQAAAVCRPTMEARKRLLERDALTCVHAPCSDICLVAGFSAFGDSASTHRALEQYLFRRNHLNGCLAPEKGGSRPADLRFDGSPRAPSKRWLL